MDTQEKGPEKDNQLQDIELRIAKNEEVSPQEMLLFLRFREKDLSAQLKMGAAAAYQPLESIRAQIEEIDRRITGSGSSGDGTTGESSLRDAHNTPRRGGEL